MSSLEKRGPVRDDRQPFLRRIDHRLHHDEALTAVTSPRIECRQPQRPTLLTRFSIGESPSGSVGRIDEFPLTDRPVTGGNARDGSAEGDGQKNRRLVLFSFRFLNRPIEKAAECAQECAQTCVPQTSSTRRYKDFLWLHLASKATA